MTWDAFLGAPFSREPYRTTLERALDLYARQTVYPSREDLFAAFALTPPERVRAVILGQDPYHGPGQAHGLAFSVRAGTPLPPSLKNVFRELHDDLGLPIPACGDLTPWARQGVLLLNTVLTVQDGQANSHAGLGWQRFTDLVIASLSKLPQPVAFVLWGAQAQKKEALVLPAAGPRLVLKSAHPSPLSAYRGFFGSRPFSVINRFYRQNGAPPIDWALPS